MPLSFWGCVLIAAFTLAVTGTAAGDSPIRSVDVSYDGETYVCDVVIFAQVQPAVAWDVLTDFEQMAGWVPNVHESKVLNRENNSATIVQHGVARFGIASFPYTTERRIEMNRPFAIRSTQVRGSLRRVESLMTLEPEGNGTRLAYHLEIVPNLLVGAFLSKRFLEHELADQFGAIVREMSRRAQ